MEIRSMMKFGEWLPDQPALNNPGVTEAKNVIPALGGYRNLKGLSAVSGAATADILGMFAGRDDQGNHAVYAADSGKIYKFNKADSALTDKSKAGGYSTADGDRWNFVQFGEILLATNLADPIQAQQIGSASVFADLAGSPPKAKFMAVVRDQLITGFTNDSDGIKPYRLRWSAINDHTAWTAGTNLSDFQDMLDIGDCTGLVGGEYVTAFYEKAIVRGTFVGAPLIYRFEQLTNALGCPYPGSVCAAGSAQMFFLSQDGFYMIQGNQLNPVGAEKIDEYFFGRLASAYSDNIISAVDPTNQLVVWAYPSVDSADGSNDELVIYNYRLNRWSRAVVDCDDLAPLNSAGYTLEELDGINSSIDAHTTSFDDAIYKGGTFFFAGAKDKKIQSFTGAVLDATIETNEFATSAGQRSVINAVLPYITHPASESPTISVSVGSRLRQIDAPVFSTATTQTTDGYCPQRSHGQFHRVRMSVSGTFDIAQGVDVATMQLGFR
jgi:hypothetical protein